MSLRILLIISLFFSQISSVVEAMEVNFEVNTLVKKRASRACKNCRRNRIKCDGELPCRPCQESKHDIPCAYDPPRKRGPKTKNKKNLMMKNSWDVPLFKCAPTNAKPRASIDNNNTQADDKGDYVIFTFTLDNKKRKPKPSENINKKIRNK